MPTDPFVVHVARLRRTLGTRWHEVRSGPVDLLADLRPSSPLDTAVPPEADVTCDVHLESFAGGVMVAGVVRAPWHGVCGRCTAAVDGEVQAQVKERFVDAAEGAPPDEEAYPIVEDQLDLKPMARDAIVLELPLAPLCRPDCAGLCPQCGADRNEEQCGCVAQPDPRWASLDVLR